MAILLYVVKNPVERSDDSEAWVKDKRSREKTHRSFCVQGCKYKGKESDDMVQCHLCQMWVHCACIGEQPDNIIGLWSCHTCRTLPSVIMNFVEKVSTLETTMLQPKENNAELAKLIKAQCIVNDTIQDEKGALIEQLACLRGEMKSSIRINALFDQMDTLSSEFANIVRISK